MPPTAPPPTGVPASSVPLRPSRARRPRRRALLPTLAASAALVAAVGTPLPPSDAAPAPTRVTAGVTSGRHAPVPYTRHLREQARQSDALVDSVGVNIHLRYYDTPYADFDHLVKPLLLRLGVRHVRDAAYTGDESDGGQVLYYQRLHDLTATGIGLDLVTTAATATNPGTDYTRLADVDAWTGHGVTTFEGANEADLSAGQDWVADVTQAQRELATATRQAPGLAGVKVVAPALVSSEAASSLGSLGGSADYGNIHDYFSDRQPETAGWGADGYGSVGWSLRHIAGRVVPKALAISTETGYYTSPTSDAGVSPKVAGFYVPRIILKHFADHVPQTYLYELLDEGTDKAYREDNFGLVRHDGTPKPAYTALQSMIRLLSDPGPRFTPGRLSYSLTGAGPAVHHLLLQKRDGQFVLALWLADSSWNSDTDTAVRTPAQPVRVTVARGHRVGRVVRLSPGQTHAKVAPGHRSVRVRVGAPVTFVAVNPAR